MTTFKKFLALALALVMMAGAGVGVVATSAANANGTYDDAINYLAALGVFKGYGDGDNGADDDILRYQMALFFVRVMTGTTDDSAWAGTSTFDDVKDYAGAIGYVQGLGVINGVGDNKFAPNDGIRYQDALVMAIRALEYDTPSMSYPYGYISKAIQLGLTSGIKGVGYGDTLTRGETAQVIYNVLNTPVYSQGGFIVDGAGNVKFDKDSTTFLAMNFNTDTATATLEATNNSGVEKTGYVQFSGGYKLAKENVVNYGALGSIDEAVGYSFNVVFNKDSKEILAATICDMAVYENLGASAEFAPSYDKNGAAKDGLLVAGDVTYKLLVANETDKDTDNYDGIHLYVNGSVTTNIDDLYFDNTTSVKDSALLYNYGKLVLVESDEASEGYDEAYFYPYAFLRIRFIEARDGANNNAVTKFAAIQNLANGSGYYFLDANGNLVDVATYFGKTLAQVFAAKPTDLKVVGKDDIKGTRELDIRGTVSNGDFVLAYYNDEHNYLDVASVASVKTGRLTAKNNSAVTISGTRYNFGFLGDVLNVTTGNVDGNITASTYTNGFDNSMVANSTVKAFVDARIADLAQLKADEANVNYVVMGGRVVWMEKASNATTATTSSDNKFVLVDLNWDENTDANNPIALDKNNNIVLWAVTEDGGKEQIKVSAIYDSKVNGAFVAAKDLKNAQAYFMASGVETSWGEKAFKNYKAGGAVVSESNLDTFLAQFGDVKMFSVISVTNGTYVLDVNADYAVANSGVLAIQSVNANAYAKAEFRNGTLSKLNNNTNMADYGISASRLIFDKDATIVLFDGTEVVVNGVPENGAWIDTNGAKVYAASSKLLVLEYADVDGMYNWKKTTTGLQPDGNAVYVAISGAGNNGSGFLKTVEDENGNPVAVYGHEITKVLNLATMAVENKTFKTTSMSFGFNLSKGNVNVVKTNEDGYAEIVAAGKTDEAYYAVAKALGWNFGKITTIGDAYEIAITGDATYENRTGVTNTSYNFTNGSSINSYEVFAIYTNSDNNVVTATVTDASTGTGKTIFEGKTNVTCLYKYDATADHMDVIAFVG